MKKNKENKKENEKKDIQKNLDELDLEKVLDKKRKKKRIVCGIITIIVIIVVAALVVLNYFYGNKAYLRGDVKIYSSSKVYLNSEPEDSENVGEGALFILYIDGIKRDKFLAEYEVNEININNEIINLENITYRHLNNALSIRLHSENYNLEKGNVVIISIKEKSSGLIMTKRLYHTTEVL